MIDISLGNNPFLTVTADELDRNIQSDSERLKPIKQTYGWRKKHNLCVKCGCELLEYTFLVCSNCKTKY